MFFYLHENNIKIKNKKILQKCRFKVFSCIADMRRKPKKKRKRKRGGYITFRIFTKPADRRPASWHHTLHAATIHYKSCQTASIHMQTSVLHHPAILCASGILVV